LYIIPLINICCKTEETIAGFSGHVNVMGYELWVISEANDAGSFGSRIPAKAGME
jgi:hypothetical protein